MVLAMTSQTGSAARQRIGILGGSFDPIHIGHLVAAINARHAAQLDFVLVMPAGDPWQKSDDREITPAETRYAAVEAAVRGHVGLVASRIEVDREGPTFTVDTLRQLRIEFPDADFFLILGNDAAARIETWKESAAVADLADLIIVNRPGIGAPTLAPYWRFKTVEIPALDVSSTDLRNRLVDGRPLDFLIPDAAAEVLRKAYLQ